MITTTFDAACSPHHHEELEPMRGLHELFFDEQSGPAKRQQLPTRQDQDREQRAGGQKRSVSDRTKEADLAAIKAQCELN
jgi:hypothetical protein